MAQHITVVIENGKAVISTKGFSGVACKDATKMLERALGATTSDTATEEMNKPQTLGLRAGAGQ
jgi:hypothetical protein